MNDKHDMGLVILVGAGPGGPELLTREGARWISKAETILYDRLSDNRLLDMAAADAEKIFVGKSPGDHSMSQEEINALLVEKASKGRLTVRLKGGDPLIFGRGGEEADALAEAKIPFRIVPGITAASAGSACAGIPLTDRRCASSVAFVTGHEDPAKSRSSIDFDALAGIDTVVFYMGVGRAGKLADALMEAGRDRSTPAAIIGYASMPGQKTVVATLGTLEKAAKDKSIAPPALIIVGHTVSFADRLDWFERLPLKGSTVLVTGSSRQAGPLEAALNEQGAGVIFSPMISIEPPDSFDDLDDALRKLAKFDWVVLTSPAGVEHIAIRLERLGLDARVFAGTSIAAVGSGTAAALGRIGLKPDLIPPVYTTRALADALVDEGVSGRDVLMLRSDIAPLEIVERLQGAGAAVKNVTSYRTIKTPTLTDRAREALSSGLADWIVFTSSSTAESFAAAVSGVNVKKSRMASMGPVTSQKLKELGFRVDAEADPHNVTGLVDAIVIAETKG